MTDYNIKNIRFDFEKIKDLLDNCSQLEQIAPVSDEDDFITYFDVMTGIKYTIFSDKKRLEIQSGTQISGRFDETEYILKVLRAIVQNSYIYEKNCPDADKYISSVIGYNIQTAKYSF